MKQIVHRLVIQSNVSDRLNQFNGRKKTNRRNESKQCKAERSDYTDNQAVFFKHQELDATERPVVPWTLPEFVEKPLGCLWGVERERSPLPTHPHPHRELWGPSFH